MKIYQKSLLELCELRQQFILEGLDVEKINELILEKEIDYTNSILEDGPGGAAAAASIGVGGGGVGYANASIGGMGDVVSSQPSQFAGATLEPNFSAGGGRVGSGDISVAYNPGGRKKTFQKLQAPMDSRRGSSKRRRGKLLQGLKNLSANKQDFTAKQGEVKSRQPLMSFDKFSKDKINQVTKVSQ
jgi:hypothetical protein